MCISCAPGNASRARRSVSVATGAPPWLISASDDVSRGRARCSSQIAASIVGTTSVAVIRSASIRSSAAPGSNAGSTTWRPACQTVARTAIEPAAWNSGGMISHRVSGPNGHAPWKCSALAIRLRWVRITPLAAPVVPPV